MYYSYVEIEYVATSFSPARMDLAVKLLRLIWQIPRRHHSRRQYPALFLSSLCYLKIYLKPSPYPGISVVKRRALNYPSHYWIKWLHVIDMTLTLTSSLMREMHSKMNCWCCLRVFVFLVTGNSTKNCFAFWWKQTRPYMEIMEMFQTNFWIFSFWVVQESEIIWIGHWEPLILCSHSLIKPFLTNMNSLSTIVWPNQFNIPCSQCLQCQPFITNLELDGIISILTITSKIITKWMKWVMWYNKKKKSTAPQ